VGLAQRDIEKAGFTTVSVSNIPDLTAAVKVPRIAAIEYPFGRTFGREGDAVGQRAVLQGALEAVEEMQEPAIKHLPFEWPESMRNAHVHPPEPAPIVSYLKRHPWQVQRLLMRNVPKE